jgi:hypothetical protein
MTTLNVLCLVVGFIFGAIAGALAMGVMMMSRTGNDDDNNAELRAANKAFDEYTNSIVPKGDTHDHHRSDEKFRR